MKITNKILIGIGFATGVGLIIYLVRNRRKINKMSQEVAEQGYETAHDILFPQKNKKGRKDIYGPVLPS
jgi:hypothetical protein